VRSGSSPIEGDFLVEMAEEGFAYLFLTLPPRPAALKEPERFWKVADLSDGWICTNGSGNATKGPWTWANQNGDEDAYAYIIWPDSTGTNVAHHIWDKTAPSITINSFGSTPPTSFTGSANDGSYGAGFKSDFGSESGVGYPTGSRCYVQFRNVSTGLYWCSGYTYTSSVACSVSCTISGMPSRSVTWSADQVPCILVL
jgi:hypothetical protein